MIWALLALATASPHPVMTYAWQHSCADWTKERSNEYSFQGDTGYILGLVTGYNVYGPGDGNLASGPISSGMIGWVDQYCAANPLDTIYTAGFKLVVELKRRKAS